MFYERFQNLDLDKAELEVFKLFLDSIVLFVDRGLVRIGVLSFLSTSNGRKLVRGRKERKQHHNLVCRIEPMQARLNGRVYVVKHQDRNQTRPCHKSTNQPSRKNLISFSRINKKKGFLLSFLRSLLLSLTIVSP